MSTAGVYEYLFLVHPTTAEGVGGDRALVGTAWQGRRDKVKF